VLPLVIAVVLGAFFLLPTRSAWAAPKDAAALKLDKDAIYNDYLATKFASAEKKLKKGIATCGAAGCSPRVQATLHRDLGIVYLVGGRPAAAVQGEFALAQQIDPTIGLVKELTTPEIQAAWTAAGSGGAPPAAGAAAAAAAGGEAEGAAPGPAPATAAAGGEDIVHRPPVEQTILTPVPIYCVMPEGITPAKVQVRYKPFGAVEWKTLDLKKIKGGYGAEIPCLDIGSETGDLKYYIQATDANGDIVATSGSKSAPHKVTIKNELAGEPPHLPGKPPSAQCANPGDCPPGLPGCASAKKKKGVKEWGASCDLDSECQSGSCRDGACTAEEEKAEEAKTCTVDTDCAAGQICSGGTCGARVKKNFISIAVQQDMLFLPSATDVCLNQTAYTCYFSDESQYDGTPTSDHDSVSGGLGLATTRILAGYDRLFGNNVTLGVKVGFAFNGGPPSTGGKNFMPYHVEGRFAYVFGAHPFSTTGFRPYLTANGGLAQVDSRVTVQVNDPMNGGDLTLAAWKKAGTSFVGGGAGLMWLTSPGSGFVAELRFQQLFSSSGSGLGLQIGYAFGL